MTSPRHPGDDRFIAWFEAIGNDDVPLVGGKAASLGELSRALAGSGAQVPRGFAVTTEGYREFVSGGGLADTIEAVVAAVERGGTPLAELAARATEAFVSAAFPGELDHAIRSAYQELGRRIGQPDPEAAVRSSATLEDMPGISFAGQHESFLGVRDEEALLAACRRCFASLFTERAFAYRQEMGLDHRAAALAVAVHEMVAWPDCEAAGVMFTIDTESGFPGIVNVSGNWGVGESVVQGRVSPDEFLVFKAALETRALPIVARRKGSKLLKAVSTGAAATTRLIPTTTFEQQAYCLTEGDVVQLAKWGVQLERYFGRPMDIEWAKDGGTGGLAIVQARPETVHAGKLPATLRSFTLQSAGTPLARGVAVGSAIAAGRVRIVHETGDAGFADGDILVTSATSPDWVPLMRKSSAIVTDLGGRTSHAAIVSRELGIPAVVGTQDATTRLRNGDEVTVSCAEGSDGVVYAGVLPFAAEELALEDAAATKTKVMLNLSIPEASLRWWRLPADGVGLARIEFIVGQQIGAHPMALLHPDRVEDESERATVAALAEGLPSGADYFVTKLAEGIGRIAASQYPRPVVVRLSDFKSNEYAGLVGGKWFEPPEPNPMLGLRGASRYYHPRYREAFALECASILRAREVVGLDNVVVMIPFCRTVPECQRVLEEMALHGLARGRDGLRVWMMTEVPSNVVLASEFADHVDGFSIGSNDLTQLVLGVDRDSAELRSLFSESDPAVKSMIRSVIARAHAKDVTVSFCGQAPSDDPSFAAFLVECGIDSISVTPDTLLRTRQAVANAEALPNR